jgi:hypothetical protein
MDGGGFVDGVIKDFLTTEINPETVALGVGGMGGIGGVGTNGAVVEEFLTTELAHPHIKISTNKATVTVQLISSQTAILRPSSMVGSLFI